jgi:hypothetical protein
MGIGNMPCLLLKVLFSNLVAFLEQEADYLCFHVDIELYF